MAAKYGHKLNAELVEKTIAYYQSVGREVFVWMARIIGENMIAEGYAYDSASEAVDSYKCRIWNAGLVQ